jgi:ABC-2 type transport system permease protein
MFGAVILVLNGVSGGDLSSGMQLSVMVGWVVWMVASSGMEKLPLIISGEAETGTLEQICLIPIPLAMILVVRSLAYLLGTGIKGFIAALVLLFFIRSPLSSVPILIALFFVSLIGVYGLGFLLAGLALVLKRVNALTNLIFSLMIFFTGAFVGLEKLSILFYVLRFIFPLTWGISLMRSILAGDVTWTSLLTSGELLALLLHSALYFALGLGIFAWGYRAARTKGTLAHY